MNYLSYCRRCVFSVTANINGAIRGSVFFLIIFSLLLLPASNSFGGNITGKVAYVYDGDTFRLESGLKVRLASIDTPELGKNGKPEGYYARKAANALTKLINGRTVILKKINTDRYGRAVAWVYCYDIGLVNKVMVEKGLALFYSHKANSIAIEKKLLEAQREALNTRSGFWPRILSLPLSKKEWVGNSVSRRCFPSDSKVVQKISKRHRVTFSNFERAVYAGYCPARNINFWPED